MAERIWEYEIQGSAPGAGRPGLYSSDPGDTVGWLWEEPADIAQGHIILRLILGNPNASNAPWAGCNVYLSYDDLSYALFASTSQRSIIGELSAALPAGAGTWQPAATCDVDITVSPGTLVTTDAASCQAGVNLCLIGDEVCSFVDATLIGANEYRLTGFQRGWFDTAVVLHPIGERFAMLSSLQARVSLPIPAKGQTWHVKLASLNIGRVEMAMGAAAHLTFDGKGLGATLNNTGLHLLDTNASHDLIIAPGSDLTADRILTLTTGDAARTLTFEGNAILNQDYSTDSATVQFATVTLTTGLLTPQVGPAADADLLGLAPGVLTVNGYVDAGTSYASLAVHLAGYLLVGQIGSARGTAIVSCPNSTTAPSIRACMYGNNLYYDLSVVAGSHVGYAKESAALGASGIVMTGPNAASGTFNFITANDTNDDTWVVTTAMTLSATAMVVAGTLTVNGNQTGATDHVFDEYDDLALLHAWRDGGKLPFARGDILNHDRLLRDTILQLAARIETLEARHATH